MSGKWQKWNATFFVKHAPIILIPRKRYKKASNLLQLLVRHFFE